jgi:hypothetical protein
MQKPFRLLAQVPISHKRRLKRLGVPPVRLTQVRDVERIDNLSRLNRPASRGTQNVGANTRSLWSGESEATA